MRVFAVCSTTCMGRKRDWKHAGTAACMLGAVCFRFRTRVVTG